MQIKYVTSNKTKFEEAQLVLNDWQLERIDIELPEVQGTRQEVLLAKVEAARRQVQGAFIVEDVSMYCAALNGLPGPYIKDFLRALGDVGLADLVQRYADPRAEVVCAVALHRPGIELMVVEGVGSGTVVPPRGAMQHGRLSWNAIFLPEASQVTVAEMSLAAYSQVSMRAKALRTLREKISDQQWVGI